MHILIDGCFNDQKSLIALTVSKILNYSYVDIRNAYVLLEKIVKDKNVDISLMDIKDLINQDIDDNCIFLNKSNNLDSHIEEISTNQNLVLKLKKFIEFKINNLNVVINDDNKGDIFFKDAALKILLYKGGINNYNSSFYDTLIDICEYDINEVVSKIVRAVNMKIYKNTLIDYKHFLYSAYDKDTTYKTCVNSWNRTNPTYGHCAVTSMILNECFGGVIKCGYYEKEDVWHYWNVINNQIIDFTREQFSEDNIEFTKIKTVSLKKLKSIESVYRRYCILKRRVEDIKEAYWKINNEILECTKCKGVSSPAFLTIKLGIDCRMLIIGEAPAKNGWRVTGKAWLNEDEELVPTGRVLNKLLNEIGLNIFDLTYMEAIKCYPENGKVLKTQCINCKNFCVRQIDLLKPQVIISMGKYATEFLLGKGNFSEKVGKKFYLEINENKYLVIPIYHTSPVSPLSYRGNIEIFKEIKNILK